MQHPMPSFLYGTAWKEEETARCVINAIDAGFRGIDTANQRKHYNEHAVGEALRQTYKTTEIQRSDLFLQTKWTHRRGQDHRLPYDEFAPLEEQVVQSFSSSLEHLNTDYIDAYLLHGPMGRDGLSESDWTIWRQMEALHASGAVRHIGASNLSIKQLNELIAGAKVRPSFLQNRCYARTYWDRECRNACSRAGIVYQGFSLLTANRFELKHPVATQIATKHNLSIPQLVFRFAVQSGMLPLTGTKNKAHMAADLSAIDGTLSSEDLLAIETLCEQH